jgi:uncharacterized membrane protein
MSEAPTPTESGDVERLIFFSDAVVAIAITLLALELPVPTGHTAAAFWKSARSDEGHYTAFLISFVVIAFMWAQHHRVFAHVERGDDRLRSLNMLWLLTIVLNPFATKLLTDGEHDTVATHAIRFGFYALLQVLAVATFLAMVHRLESQHLLSADAPQRLRQNSHSVSYGVLLGFGLSIPVFFAVRYAWILWIALPLLVDGWRRWHGRLRRSSG